MMLGRSNKRTRRLLDLSERANPEAQATEVVRVTSGAPRHASTLSSSVSRSGAPVAISLKDGEYVLTEGVIDDQARHVFSHGYCAELALALHRRTGWPIVSAGVWDDHNRLIPGAHFGVLVPDGRVLDIEGASEIYSWAGRWGVDGAFRELSPAQLPGCEEGLLECRAAAFVEPVLRLLDGRPP